MISEDVYSNIPPPYKLSRSFSTSAPFPDLSPSPAALIYSTISLACFSAAASLIFDSAGAAFSSVATSASAGGSASTGSAFLAAFFLGGAFLPLAGFPFPFAGAAFGFAPLAFSIYALRTSSTVFPDLSSSITS